MKSGLGGKYLECWELPVVNEELHYIIIYSDFLDCNIHIINAEKNCHIPVWFYSPCIKNMTYTYLLWKNLIQQLSLSMYSVINILMQPMLWQATDIISDLGEYARTT